MLLLRDRSSNVLCASCLICRRRSASCSLYRHSSQSFTDSAYSVTNPPLWLMAKGCRIVVWPLPRIDWRTPGERSAAGSAELTTLRRSRKIGYMRRYEQTAWSSDFYRTLQLIEWLGASAVPFSIDKTTGQPISVGQREKTSGIAQ